MTDEFTYLKEGHIAYIDDPYKDFYRIVRREPFDYETGEEDTAIFTAVASGAESGFKHITALEPDKTPLHLFQVRWGVRDDGAVKYYIKIPAGQNRFGVDVDKEIGFINATKSPYFEPNPEYEFYLLNEWYPSINCVNGSPMTITPKIWFRGYKYDIEKITDSNLKLALNDGRAPYRKIVVGGIKNTP